MKTSSTHTDFRPLPLLGNPHVQTILSTFLFGEPFHARTHSRRLVALPDGDCLVLHDSVPAGWRTGDPVVLQVHGLASSHRSSTMQRLARLFLPRGLRVVRMDLRGAGHGFALARRTYHAGSSDDVRAALVEVRTLCPLSPIVVVGISLGGNIALKLAGEAPEEPLPNVVGVAVLGPPIDALACVEKLGQPHNRFYEQHFLGHLVSAAHRRRRYFQEPQPLRFPKPMTLRLFDELYTAPRAGFADALDYYRRASAFPLIGRIDVPTLILTARDDPFIAVEPFERLTVPEHVELHIADKGGHIGFLGWDGNGGIFWAERRVVEWVMQLLGRQRR